MTWKYIQKKELLSYVQDTSTFLKIELGRIEKDAGTIKDIRGYGTFIGFDATSQKTADSL